MKRFTLITTVLAVACVAQWAQARDWTWQLPAARYQKLNPFERRQYDKAAALVEKRSYPLAAEEFEKYKAEFPDSSMLPYMIFMRGYCLERANNRITAIKVYQEVVDYFPDNVEDCAAALCSIGAAHLLNGDTLKGVKALQSLVGDPRYKDHPLAAGAFRRLGDNCWTRQQYEAAVEYWKHVVGRFAGQNDEEVRAAMNSATAWYVKNRDYAGYEAWQVDEQHRDDAAVRRHVFENAFNSAWYGFSTDWEKYASTSEKEKIDKDKLKAVDMQAFYEYYKGGRPWYEKANDAWRYHDHAMQFLTSLWPDRVAREAALNDAVTMIRTVKDKADADAKLARLVDLLREQGQHERARYVLGMMHDGVQASYKECEILVHENKWPQAVARLADVEKSGNETWKLRAMWERARVYKDCLREYQKAIKVYQEISQPPTTLWYIQECYYRSGKLKESLATLSELEAMFQDDASRAAWQKATYLIQAKDTKAAIAQARRIMKMYPKSQESASAHRWLEDNGVPSGGGVSDQ